MKTPDPWECEGKEYTFDEITSFIKHLHKVIDAEIKKVFGGGGWKAREYPIEIFIGNNMTHWVTRPWWPRKARLLETQEEILEEFRSLGIDGRAKESEKLASHLLIDLEEAKAEEKHGSK